MSVEWGWVSKQLADSNKGVNEVAVATLKSFDDAREKHLLTDDEAREVLASVQKLALGHALIRDKPDEKWGDVTPGEYNVRDIVRVREDAYSGVHGRRHNGKRGRISAVHQQKVVVIYEDALNNEESFFHEPENLQRLL